LSKKGSIVPLNTCSAASILPLPNMNQKKNKNSNQVINASGAKKQWNPV
jgi:hypothetical protein